jgi:hypothetical protein
LRSGKGGLKLRCQNVKLFLSEPYQNSHSGLAWFWPFPFFCVVQNALKFAMGEVGIIISQVGKQYFLLTEQIPVDFPKDLGRFMKVGFGNTLSKGIQYFASSPELIRLSLACKAGFFVFS